MPALKFSLISCFSSFARALSYDPSPRATVLWFALYHGTFCRLVSIVVKKSVRKLKNLSNLGLKATLLVTYLAIAAVSDSFEQ